MQNRTITREYIYELLWTKGPAETAKELSTDWHTLYSRCSDLLIPFPSWYFQLRSEGDNPEIPPLPVLPQWIDPSFTIKPNKQIHLKLFVQKRDPAFKKAYLELAAKFRRSEETRRVAELEKMNAISARKAHLRFLQEQRGKALEQAAADWQRSNLVSRFVEECNRHLNAQPCSNEERWIRWADSCVEKLNPLRNGFLERATRSFEADNAHQSKLTEALR